MSLPFLPKAVQDPHVVIGLAVVSLAIFLAFVFVFAFADSKYLKPTGTFGAYCRFIYGCFLKPHSGDGTGSQQDALESFYKAQADAYDITRARLLHGREDMLGLLSSQLKHRIDAGTIKGKPIWVDIGGGTGFNIESMGRLVLVPEFFKTVYLVDLSPSLCEIARARFERLGWKNVRVICQDARSFRLSEHEGGLADSKTREQEIFDWSEKPTEGGADLITMSYALSMIPEYYSVIDSLGSLLSPQGIIGVCDFYVQNQVDYSHRNYTGGVIDRHCMWISRVFWRLWFEVDRVNLEPARRDYLEYKFGTVLNINGRNRMLGVRIPYYIWVGCSKTTASMQTRLAEMDAAATESPFLAALDLQSQKMVHRSDSFDSRSKAYECAVVNLASRLPLPSSWYQNHHWRIYFEDRLPKHKQFKDEYIYAFTWEDSRVDARLLKIQPTDVILAITSAGDNILSLVLEKPARVHAVDLNPNQNHLLELKVAAFTALGYSDVWRLFGEGRHETFREILITKLSPHMSSLAFQYWLQAGPRTFTGKGLYNTGGSRHALQLSSWIFDMLAMRDQINKMCSATTLNEQKEIWHGSVRKVLLSRLLSWVVVGNEKWLWKALGVPPNQRNLIEQDFLKQDDASRSRGGHAIWEYVVNTLDPVVETTLLSNDNHYYLLCLQGKYSRRCHPDYLKPSAHIALSRPTSFDGLRIHTDEINEIISRMAPGTLTIAVVMDSMDWFNPGGEEADAQIKALNRVLQLKGRVMFRSAGLAPWYVKNFEKFGFACKRVGARHPGECIDRVNMYASTWICTKVTELETEGKGSPLDELTLGAAAF